MLDTGGTGSNGGPISAGVAGRRSGVVGRMISSRLGRSLVASVLLGLSLAACATAPSDPIAREQFEAENDPLRPLNEAIFEFNLAVDKALIRPAASVYEAVLPELVRDGFRNFLRHIRTPIDMANSLLQGDIAGFGDHFGRFAFNTVAGFGGVFDPAGAAGVPYNREDFGQTLAVWGFPEGPYLMLPLLGPSNVRDTTGIVADYFLDPLTYWGDNSDSELAEHNWIARGVLATIDSRSRNVDELRRLEEEAGENFYARIRSIYRQQREAQIRNGEPEDVPLVADPDYDIEFQPADGPGGPGESLSALAD